MHETSEPKKMLILYIMDILWKYSDAEHTLTYNDIIRILDEKYNMVAERKAVRRNLFNLKDFGFDVEWDETVRKPVGVKDKEQTESVVHSNFYLNRTFEDCELICLLDMVVGNNDLPVNIRQELAGKLLELGSNMFAGDQRRVKRNIMPAAENRQVLLSLEVTHEAVHKNRKVRFQLRKVKVDPLKLEPYTETTEVTVTPLGTEYSCGNYYLSALKDGKQRKYRLDMIADVKITDEKGEEVSPFAAPAKVLAEFAFDSCLYEEIKEQAEKMRMVGADDVGRIKAVGVVCTDDFKKWVISKGDKVNVTAPAPLVNDIKGCLEKALARYA